MKKTVPVFFNYFLIQYWHNILFLYLKGFKKKIEIDLQRISGVTYVMSSNFKSCFCMDVWPSGPGVRESPGAIPSAPADSRDYIRKRPKNKKILYKKSLVTVTLKAKDESKVR